MSCIKCGTTAAQFSSFYCFILFKVIEQIHFSILNHIYSTIKRQKGNNMDKSSKIHCVKSHFQVIAFAVTCIVLALIFYKPFFRFYGFDRLPVVKEFSQNVSSTASMVRIGLLINDFNTFKIETGEFTFAGSVWFEYDPQQISLEKIKKFHIWHGKITSISDPDVRTIGRKELARFEMTASFRNSLNYAAFPLDDHSISIGIFNYSFPKGTIIQCKVSDFQLEKPFHISGWEVILREVKAGYVDRIFGKDNAHRAQENHTFFILKCKRTDPVTLITIVLSLMLIMLVSVLSFSIRDSSTDLISGAIGGLIAFRFVLAAMSPAHVGYFMVSDYLFVFTLIGVITAVLSCIAARQLHWRESSQNLVVIGIYGFFVVACASIFLLLLV